MMMLNGLPVQEVHTDEIVTYHCNRCGVCCHHIKNAIMLEPIDIYNLAKHFHRSPSLVLDAYAELVPLDESGLPIFLLKAVEPDDTCIFYFKNRCIVQSGKPQTCRLYPFSVGPGERNKLQYFLCMEKTHHFTAGKIHVDDWLKKHFGEDDTQFKAEDYEFIPLLATVLNALPEAKKERAIAFIILFRYMNFDFKQPFLPQYKQNNRELILALQRLAAEAEKEKTYERYY